MYAWIYALAGRASMFMVGAAGTLVHMHSRWGKIEQKGSLIFPRGHSWFHPTAHPLLFSLFFHPTPTCFCLMSDPSHSIPMPHNDHSASWSTPCFPLHLRMHNNWIFINDICLRVRYIFYWNRKSFYSQIYWLISSPHLYIYIYI